MHPSIPLVGADHSRDENTSFVPSCLPQASSLKAGLCCRTIPGTANAPRVGRQGSQCCVAHSRHVGFPEFGAMLVVLARHISVCMLPSWDNTLHTVQDALLFFPSPCARQSILKRTIRTTDAVTVSTAMTILHHMTTRKHPNHSQMIPLSHPPHRRTRPFRLTADASS